MPRLRDDKYKMSELAKRLEELRTSVIGEPASFDGFGSQVIESILETALDFHPDVPDSEKRKLIWKAISLTATAGKITADALNKHFESAEKEYLSIRPNDFVLATSLTIDYFDKLPRLNLDRNQITFSRNLPPHLIRKPIEQNIRRAIKIKRPEVLTAVTINVKARTDTAALSLALETLDYYRGVVNFILNERTSMQRRFGVREPKPMNQVLRGPIHTIHSVDGSLINNNFWYEPLYLQYDGVYKMNDEWEYVSKWYNHTLKILKKHPYSQEIRKLFIRYGRALDNADFEVAFYKLWAVLESLTNSPGRYDQLIKRVLFIESSDDRDFARLLLEHLRDLRNNIVHDDKSRSTMLTHVHELKWLIETLFRYHLIEGHRFPSFKAAIDFLDLPADITVLQSKISDYRKALRFHKESKTQS